MEEERRRVEVRSGLHATRSGLHATVGVDVEVEEEHRRAARIARTRTTGSKLILAHAHRIHKGGRAARSA